MNKLNINRGSWIVTVPIIVLNLGLLYFCFLPAKKEIEMLRTEMTAKQEYLAQSVTQKATILRLEKNLAKAKTFNQDWRSVAPSSQNVSQLFGEISSQAKLAGVDVTKFDPHDTAAMEHLHKVTLQLGTEGSFDELFSMLQGLERMPASIWVESLKIRGEKSRPNVPGSPQLANQEPTVRSEINLAIFATKQKKSD